MKSGVVHKTRRFFVPALMLILILCAVSIGGAASDPLKIFYIPMEDLNKAPGYSSRGARLPLSELLDLVEKASVEKEKTGDPLDYCSGLSLSGFYSEGRIDLSGNLDFHIRGEGWSVLPLDEGNMPWISQAAPEGVEAYLVRVNGKTFLAARGPVKASLELKALYSVPLEDEVTSIQLGPIYCPGEVNVLLPPEIRIKSNVPFVKKEGDVKRFKGMTSYTFALDMKKAGRVELRRKIDINAPECLRTHWHRMVFARGNSLSVSDVFIFQNRYKKGSVLEIPLPENLRCLNASSKDPISVELLENAIRVECLRDMNLVRVEVSSACNMTGNRTRLLPWPLEATALRSAIEFVPGKKYAPVPLDMEPGVDTEFSKDNILRYKYPGLIPEMDVELVSLKSEMPLKVSATLKILRNESEAECLVNIADRTRRDLEFIPPENWVLADVRTDDTETILRLQNYISTFTPDPGEANFRRLQGRVFILGFQKGVDGKGKLLLHFIHEGYGKTTLIIGGASNHGYIHQ